MRRLLPPAPSTPGVVDLDAAYAWPTGERCLRANMVASVDGAAMLDDVSGTLSGPADRRLFAVLRGLADVVLVGAGTVRRENYGGVRPTATRQQRRRDAGRPAVPPIAVVSRALDLDPAGRLFTDTMTRPLVITCSAAPAGRRAALAAVAGVILAGEDTVDLGSALDALAALGLRRVLCEGGPRLLGQLVAEDRVDELCLTVSPLLVGGPAGRLLDGPPPAVPVGLRLVAALEHDDALFLRYGRSRSGAPPVNGRTAAETP